MTFALGPSSPSAKGFATGFANKRGGRGTGGEARSQQDDEVRRLLALARQVPRLVRRRPRDEDFEQPVWYTVEFS